MDNYIRAYEKSYKRINTCCFSVLTLGIIISILCCCILIRNDISIIYLEILIIIFLIAWFYFREKAFVNNISKMSIVLKKDLDIDLVLDIHEQLLKRKGRKDYSLLLISYLNMLLVAGEFQMYKEIYILNRKRLQMPGMEQVLGKFCESFRSIKREEIEIDKFSSNKKKLSEDVLFEMKLLYEANKYRELVGRIEAITWDNAYNKLVGESYKQRCLYKLKEEYRYPDETTYPFLFVTKWKTLLETGEEFFLPEAEEFIHLFKQDCVIIKKKKRKTYILGLTCLVVGTILSVIFIGKYKDLVNQSMKIEHERNEQVDDDFVSNLETWNYETRKVYGMCENEDIAGAIIYSARQGDDSDVVYLPVYYIAVIDYYKEGIIPMMRLNCEQIIYNGSTKVYTAEGESSTYVAIIAEEYSEISYDGKVLEDIKIEKVKEGSFFKESYAHCFIMKGIVDPTLFKIE